MPILFFLIPAVLFFHAWIGYPVALYLLRKLVRDRGKVPESRSVELPFISIVIPVYNAEGSLGAKLRNTISLDYPEDKFEIIVVSDGSTDGTVEAAGKFEDKGVKVIDLVRNQGKSSAQNAGVRESRGSIIVFTDMDSILDGGFLKNIVPAFSDPRVASVGGMALLRGQDNKISESHGLYWKIEQFIRLSESDLGMLHSLPGWGFAIRRSDFVWLAPDTGDDMILPLDVALRGKRSVIATGAIVSDQMPSSIKSELKARQRITLRNLTGLLRRKALLNPFKYPRYAFAIWSHKLFRWFSPVLLMAIFSASVFLSLSGYKIFGFLLSIQILFYAIGIVGLVLMRNRKVRLPLVGFVTSFLVANTGFFLGLVRFVSGRRIRVYRNC